METLIQKPSVEQTPDQTALMLPPSHELQKYAATQEGQAAQTFQPETPEGGQDPVTQALVERFQNRQQFKKGVHNAVKTALQEQGLVDDFPQHRVDHADRVIAHGRSKKVA